MRSVLFAAGVFLSVLVAVEATIGGDVSEFYDEHALKCAKDKGWDFVIARSYCSYGGVDPNGKKTMEAAKKAGIPYHDVYHFPCMSVGAKKQVEDNVNHVGKDNFGTLWFDIETNPSPGCGWPSDKSKGCHFLGELIHAAKEMGCRVGVYASEYEWGQTVGHDCKVGHDLPLWYAHYDGKRSFGDFSPFGGWDKPAMKQYDDTVGGLCGINADANWYP
jgi:GH25 family lysozyme M1 (1,4-beta-N-acetylmuramidase)